MCTIPLLKDVIDKGADNLEKVYKQINFESKGLTCRNIEGLGVGEVDKELRYNSIRSRISTYLEKLFDEELEEKIRELEEYKDQAWIRNKSTYFKEELAGWISLLTFLLATWRMWLIDKIN